MPIAVLGSLGLAAALLLAVPETGNRVLFVPAAALIIAPIFLRPRAVMAIVLALVVLCENGSFGLFTFTSHLYDQVYKGLTPLDGLVLLAAASVGLELIRERHPLRLPKALGVPIGLLTLAMIGGAVTAYATGSSVRSAVLDEHVLWYLLLLPVSIVNLDLDRRQLELAFRGLLALAIVKAALGLFAVATGHGDTLLAATTGQANLPVGASPPAIAQLTYYEPTANSLIMMTGLALLALTISGFRPRLWVLLVSAPLLTGSFVLSYRRSFWIGAVVGVAVVILLGLSPARRRLLVPIGLLIAVAIWVLSSVSFQAQSPLLERATSLAPSSVVANAEDRYRFDERANVLGEIRRHPISGIGAAGQWDAFVTPLGVEHVDGRRYVHFAALFFWLDYGVLGLGAYVALLASGLFLAWRAWRASNTATARAFGLASLGGIAGLAVMETSATWTGVDPRFTALLAAQLALLATIVCPRDAAAA